MLVNDARGNPVTASGPLPVALLDDAVEAYLGFRKDTGDRLKAALTAEPDCALAQQVSRRARQRMWRLWRPG
jgi:hypothetical protein